VNPVVCIAGPTASGKSAWAVNLAKSVGGEIINADALQVYGDLRLLSARPSQIEMAEVPHHLFGHVEGRVRYSTGKWLDEVVPVIMDVLARGQVPILVGGTGLYFKALTEGLAAIPAPHPGAIKAAQKLLDTDGISALRERAKSLDPVATARVLGDDPQRLLRIMNVATGTDKPLSLWQQDTRPIIPGGFWRGAVLLPERQALYERINNRYGDMIEGGGLDEAKAVLAQSYDPNLPMMKAIGLSPLIAYLVGETDFEAALELSKRDTRRFAKRQFTWWRGQSDGWSRIETENDREKFSSRLKNDLAFGKI